jgi:RimJ/RimL family protein N-acetyltransferase
MGIHLIKSEKAQELLEDAEFTRQWMNLYENCPWATVFQDVQYLSIWNRHYKNVCELFFIYETDENENLIGLFPLARCKKSDKIFIAGDYHSEYQTWLAIEENGDEFAEKAIDLLSDGYPKHRLQLMFLAPNTPLRWLEGKWGKQIRLQSVPRPLVDLGGENSAEISLRKRGNKTRIRQLKKQGELKFDELTCPIKFGEIFDEIESFSRLRVSGIHNTQLATDKNRKPFHIDLMKETDLVHPTLLTVGEKITSAQVCLQNRDEMLLSITAMSPFFAKQSPSKIHLLMLENELFQTDYKKFDLSPGNGYKQRFANETEESYSLTVFFNKTDFRSYKLKRKAFEFGRQTLEKVNIKKTKIFRFADKFVHKLKRLKISTVPRTIFKNIGKKIYEYKECRMYSFDVEKVSQLENSPVLKVDYVPDLLKYKPVEGWQDTISQFHQKVLRRFEAGTHSYSFADDETLLHYGWLLERQKVSNVYEVGQSFELPENTAVLFDYYTHPQARGQKLYQKAIIQGLHDAAKVPETKQVFIGVLADNLPSRHVIEKLGFKYEGSLFQETHFGVIKKWQNWDEESQIEKTELVLQESYSV